MEQETLKLGIVGAGGICNGCHLPAYCKMKNVDIVAVCDIKIERAVALAKKYVDKTGKPEPAVFEKYTDLSEISSCGRLCRCRICFHRSLLLS